MNVIIVGGGQTAYFLARQFERKGYHPSLIVRNPDEAKTLAHQLQSLVILGDGSSPAALEEAGARRVDVMICLTPHDEDNLVACQLARQLYGVPRTIAVVNDPENEDIFAKLGVSAAFSASRLIATLLEQRVGFEEVINLVPAEEGGLNVTEIILRPGAPAVDKTLLELELPPGSLIAGIIRADQSLIPRGGTRLHLADRVLVITTPECHQTALRALLGHEA